jgi:mevalonate kinase
VQPPLIVLYSGGKRPTPEVIALVESRRASSPDGFASLFDAMDAVTLRAWEAIGRQDWRSLGGVLNDGQALMERLGVSDDRLESMLAWLRARAGVWGAKISGSGLGDCVLAIGTAEAKVWPFEFVPVGVSARGVTRETGEPRC